MYYAPKDSSQYKVSTARSHGWTQLEAAESEVGTILVGHSAIGHGMDLTSSDIKSSH